MLRYFAKKDVDIVDIPHEEFYNRIRPNISDADYQVIENELGRLLDECIIEKKPIRSNFVPGHDWTDTIYNPIFEACQKEVDPVEKAGFMFGIILFKKAIDRSELWYFHDDKEDKPGKLYFLADDQ